MARSEEEVVREAIENENASVLQKNYPTTIDGVEQGAYLAQEKALRERGMTSLMTDEGTSFKPDHELYRGEMFQPDGTPVQLADETDFTRDVAMAREAPRVVSDPYAMERAQIDAIIRGSTDSYGEDVEQYKAGVTTVQDELISFLEQQYNEEFVDQGVLHDIDFYTPEEVLQRVESEFMRMDANRVDTRNLLAMNLMRQGFSKAPAEAIDGVWRDLTPNQTRALLEGYRKIHLDELNGWIDKIAAREGEGFTSAKGVEEVILQDVTPFYGATTRVLGTNKFLPDEVEIGILRRGFPGEVRQELREWFATAGREERLQWLEELDREWQTIRKGSNSKFYTRMLVIENLMGTFTEDLLNNEDPTDTFDRVMGNLDTGLGMLVGIGLFIKRGKSIFELWNGGKYNAAGQVARAARARQAQEALNQAIKEQAEALGFTVDEVAVADLIKPKQMELNFGIDVDTDSVRHVTTPNDVRRAKILEYTDDADIHLLSSEEMGNAVKREIQALDDLDGVHVHHKMSSLRGLPNNTGFEITVTIGEMSGKGWNNLNSLLDDLKQLDPYETFRIMRRGKDGKLEEIPVKFSEIADYYATGRIPYAMEEFIERTPDAIEASRYFAGRKISSVPTHELAQALDNGWIPADMPAWGIVRREIDARNNPEILKTIEDPMKFIDGDEFFVQFDKAHYFDHKDVVKGLGPQLFRYFNELGRGSFSRMGFFGRLFPPSIKFDNLYKATRLSYQMEEATLAEFADILVPFDKLSSKRKVKVAEIVEEVEDFAKESYNVNGVAERPDDLWLMERFPEVDQQTWDGYFALRDTMDGMYDVLNRRLYRDFNNRGFRTMRGTDDKLPSYSGKPLDGSNMGAGHYYDPVKREVVQLNADEVKGLLDDGGGALELDLPLSDKNGAKFTRVLARKGDYQIGKLSETPLKKYEGYHFRFYEDPYFVIKRTYSPVLNGKVVTKKQVRKGKIEGYGVDPEGRVYYDEAVRTAQSPNDAMRFLNRRGNNFVDDGSGVLRSAYGPDAPHAFLVKASKQINQTEGSLYTTQELHRSGRLFWDERSFERLPDTTGNRAKITDPAWAVQKGLAMGMRQSTQEGMFKALKNRFKEEYGDLPAFQKKKWSLEADELRDVERTLDEGLAEAFGDTRTRYKEAIEIVRYMRSQLGTDTALVPWLRKQLLATSTWIESMFFDRTLGTGTRGAKAFGSINRFAQGVDPFATARKAAYYTFMVFRPFRQALLQSSQISFLTGLEPKYIASGRVFSDAYALRTGLARTRMGGIDNGWSDAAMAKQMGLSKKEYKRVIEEFQRSGFLGSVNTHAYNAGDRGFKAALPKGGILDRTQYGTRRGAHKLMNTFKKIGFEWGERNNLTFSWLTALRRFQRENKIKDLTKMTRSDWNKVAEIGDHLALGMTRPNKFGYQSGATGMFFQFLSFQHRAMLSMLGLNPAIKGTDVIRLVAANYMLWGSNILGLEDQARDFLTSIGVDPQSKAFGNTTWQDIYASGLIEVAFNSLGYAISKEAPKLNIGILAPGAAVVQLYKTAYEMFTEAPIESKSVLGPVGTPVHGFLRGMQLINSEMHNPTKSPSEKLLRGAGVLMYNVFPQVSDITRTVIAHQMQDWADKDGDSLGIQPTITSLAARGFFGIRSKEEMSVYRARQIMWDDEKTIQAFVDDMKPYMKQLVEEFAYDDRYTDEEIYEKFATILSFTETAPEGVREEIARRLMTEPDLNGKTLIDILAEGMTAASSSLDKLLPLIEQSTTFTAEQKRMFSEQVQEAIEANARRDQLWQEQTRGELENRGSN